MITDHGLYPDLDVDEYHDDPFDGGSLSHSGAKTILKTPALFEWEREHGRPNKPAFDFGHAAHRMVLGDGMDLVVVQKVAKDGTKSDAGDYQTKSAQEHRDAIHAEGKVPLLAEQLDTVTAMAEKIRQHPIAGKLLSPDNGATEVSAFALDARSGVTIRCRYDLLPPEPTGRRLIIPDYKSCVSADRIDFGKAAANYGYDLQDAWYSAIAKALGLAADVAFLFVAQEKSAPFLVNVVQLDHVAARIGAIKMRRAIDTYKHCIDTNDWPGYPPEVALASLPVWEERLYETDLAS